jgi:SAM-dependent methyltransferase
MSNDEWQAKGLPNSLNGLSFLEVGCWEGVFCVEAKRRGAKEVVGIDYCTSPDLLVNLERENFTFIQMDILSDKSLQLPVFDLVYSAGVLYHLEDPLGFLLRLRNLTSIGGSLVIETTCLYDGNELPILLYHPRSDFDENPSNWWTPNETCLVEMLHQAGFEDVNVISRSNPKPSAEQHEKVVGRICIKAKARERNIDDLNKLLPRRPTFMPYSPGKGSRNPSKSS